MLQRFFRATHFGLGRVQHLFCRSAFYLHPRQFLERDGFIAVEPFRTLDRFLGMSELGESPCQIGLGAAVLGPGVVENMTMNLCERCARADTTLPSTSAPTRAVRVSSSATTAGASSRVRCSRVCTVSIAIPALRCAVSDSMSV